MRNRKIGPHLFVISAAVTFSALAHPCKASGAQNESGWTLSQMSRLRGNARVKFDSNHVKIENPKTGLVTIATGPPWKMISYNNSQKLIFETDFSNAAIALNDGFTGDAEFEVIENARLEKLVIPQPPIAGQKTRAYFMRNAKAFLSKGARGAAAYREQFSPVPSIDAVAMSSIDYWVSTDINVLPQVSRFMCAMYRVPYQSGVPLRLKAKDANGRPILELDTFSCVAGKIPLSEFAIPKGYKKVLSFRDMQFDQGTQSQVLEMMQGFMDSPEERAPKSKGKQSRNKQ